MEAKDCPLPEVYSSLSPFIKSREEVSAIRRNLQAYLQKQLPLDDTPLSAVNLTTPLEEDLDEPPPGLIGVRKAYWRALRANQNAQAKYDALKADLDALKRPAQPASAESQTQTISINESHIPLLRQKEKLRRLKVLEKAYTSLPALPPEPLEDHLKAHLGEQPTPPSTHPPSAAAKGPSSSSPEVEARLLDLKKAILATQRSVQAQESRNALTRAAHPSASSKLSASAQIAGLQSALQVLTEWMEEQLTVIADAEAEAAVPPTPARERGGVGGKGNAVAFEAEEAEKAYERYLAARKRVVAALTSPPGSEDDRAREPLFPPSTSTTSTSKPLPHTPPPPLLLPHIPALTQAKTHTTSTLQQKAHLRSLLSSSEGQTARVLARLAGESHLVPPGASRGRDWGDASREADGEIEEVVGSRVRAGEKFAREAGERMEGIERVG